MSPFFISRPAPFTAFARALTRATGGLAALGLGLGLAGCAITSESHYVKSAHVRTSSPTLPAINPSAGKPHHLAGLRVSHGTPNQGALRTRDDLDGMRFASFHGYPGNYRVTRDRTTAALELQAAPFSSLDFFLSAEGTPGVEPRGLLTAGLGLTIPFPWMHVRFAPAFGTRAYRASVTDSIVYQYDYVIDSVRVDTQTNRSQYDIFGAASVSLWIPRAATGAPFAPFLQYQWNALQTSSRTLSSEVLDLRVSTFTAGADYETSWGHVQVRMSREDIRAKGVSTSYRGDLGIYLHLSGENPEPPKRRNAAWPGRDGTNTLSAGAFPAARKDAP